MADNSTALVVDDETKQMTSEAQAYLDAAAAMTIKSVAEAGHAANELTAIKRKARELDERRRSMTKPLDESKKKIMDFFRGPLDFLTKAEGTLKRKIAYFHKEQERLAAQEAEEERKRVERNAEKRAQTAEKNGDIERAEEIRHEGQMEGAAAASNVSNFPKPRTGVSTRVNWKMECTSIKELAKAVVEGNAPPHLLSFNQTEGNKYAKAVKDSMPAPAGTRIFKDEIVTARA